MPEISSSILGIKKDEPESKNTVQTVYDHMADIDSAQKTLLSRRQFSVRKQIFLGNVLVFLFVLVIVSGLTLNNNQLEERLKFLEFVNDFSS